MSKTPHAETEDEANAKSIVATKGRVDLLVVGRKLNWNMKLQRRRPAFIPHCMKGRRDIVTVDAANVVFIVATIERSNGLGGGVAGDANHHGIET